MGQQPPEYDPYRKQQPQPEQQQQPPQQPPYQPYGAPPPAPAPYGFAPAPFNPGAPYGVDPLSGLPYSDKSKLVAGLLQILIPLGIGRFYMGQTGLGVAQLLVTIFTCGLGSLWPFIDGIMILVGNPRDSRGLPMKMN